MTDPRVERLAELVVRYSLELEEGRVLRIDAPDVASPLVGALYRAALAAGANPYANIALEGLAELLVERGPNEQLDYISPVQWHEIATVDAVVTV